MGERACKQHSSPQVVSCHSAQPSQESVPQCTRTAGAIVLTAGLGRRRRLTASRRGLAACTARSTGPKASSLSRAS